MIVGRVAVTLCDWLAVAKWLTALVLVTLMTGHMLIGSKLHSNLRMVASEFRSGLSLSRLLPMLAELCLLEVVDVQRRVYVVNGSLRVAYRYANYPS